jgi:hypothetical protein
LERVGERPMSAKEMAEPLNDRFCPTAPARWIAYDVSL